MRNFDGKTAFITGGAAGFGLALARSLGRRGTSVMLADVDRAALIDAVKLMRSEGAIANGVFCDVTERASVENAAIVTNQRFGAVHLLCNNAGVAVEGLVAEASVADWDWVFGVNVMGVVNGIAAFLPSMLNHGEDAHIVNTASIAGLRGVPTAGVYCASKAAVISLSEALSAELAGTNVRVTILCPSFMKTDFLSGGKRRQARFGGPRDNPASGAEQMRERIAAMIEEGHPPEQIAEFVVSAIGDERRFVTTKFSDRVMIAEQFDAVLNSFESAKSLN